MRRVVLLACLVTLPPLGCASTELHRDQDKLRNVVLDLYTNQIFDNLIRATNCMPFVQMDYGTITGNVTVKETANIGGNQELDTTRVANTLTATASGMLASVTRLFKNFLSYGATGENTNQISMVGTPVNNIDEVYEAYFQYLKLPNALIV